MKQNYLFPYRFKKIGWIITIPTLILGIYILYTGIEPKIFDINVISIFDSQSSSNYSLISSRKNNILNEITMIILLLSLTLVAFSKEKNEDELIQKIRFESLIWATYINIIVLIITILFIFDFSFFIVMEVNMFTTLIFFIIRFNIQTSLLKKSVTYEE